MSEAQMNRRGALGRLSGATAWCLSSGGPAAVGGATQPDRLRIGQIGVGHAHATKLSVYRQSPDYEVVGIAEPDPELRARAAAQPAFRDLPWLTTEQLLNVPGLQAVLVETRVRDLLPTAQLCIDAGLHIHLDKPAGTSLPPLQKLLAQAEQHRLLVQLGYMYRYNPGYLLLRQLHQQGWLGDVFEVHAVMSKVVDDAGRRALAEYPGGMMLELGCHLIDLVVGLLGAPTAVAAFPRHAGPQDDQLQDNMLAVLQYPRATATIRSSGLEVDGFARRQLVVCGTGGTLHIQPLDKPTAQLTLSAPHGSWHKGQQTVPLPDYVRYTADAQDMALILRGAKSSDYSYAHDLTVQSTILQACGLSTTE